MSVTKTVTRFFSIAVVAACGVCGSASASEHRLTFHGAMTNATCEAHPSPTLGEHTLHPVNIDPQITLGLTIAHDACEGNNLPLVAHYAEQSFPESGVRTAVVTLTYQ
jgi:hypothetical protein